MIVIEQLTLDHARSMNIQEAQLSVGPLLASDEYIESLIAAGPAYALKVDGITMIMAGVSIYWKGRAYAWAIVSKLAGSHMKLITKEVRKFLAQSDIKRIETAVDCRFDAGHRWAKLLGFTYEGTMRSWGPQGDDFDLYSRIR